MRIFEFTHYGKPVPKGSVRVRTVNTKDGRTFSASYMPSKTRKAMSSLGMSAIAALNGEELFKGPIVVTMRVYIDIPKSFSKKNRELAINGGIRPVTRPDVDNYCKLMFDSLNSVVFHDDAQCVQINAGKYYGDRPRTEIRVQEFIDDAEV